MDDFYVIGEDKTNKMNNSEMNSIQKTLKSVTAEISALKSVIQFSLEQTQKSFHELLLEASKQQKDLNVIKFLVSSGANVDYFTIENCTPLYYAIVNYQYDIVKYLIKCGATTNKVTTAAFNRIEKRGQDSKKMTTFIGGLL